MFKINNLEVATDNKIILKDFNLIINDGEIHTIMGPNGVGKSTLSRVIMGDPNYKVLNGEMTFNGDNLMVLSTDERAKKGIFLAMQYPMEIEGVSNQDFLRTAIGSVNNKRIGLYDFILDSGLDVDSLRIVGENIKKYKEENPNTSILIITHHPKILEYLKPDFVHVMSKGKILETGDYSLANDIEKNGYNKYLNKENVITKEVNNE